MGHVKFYANEEKKQPDNDFFKFNKYSLVKD